MWMLKQTGYAALYYHARYETHEQAVRALQELLDSAPRLKGQVTLAYRSSRDE